MTIVSNRAYEPLYKGGQKYTVLIGGAGSGKSYAAADHVILSMIRGQKRRWIVARRVARTIRQSVFTLIVQRLKALGLDHLFKVNRSDLVIEGPNDSAIVFVGLDDVDKLKSIYDPTDAWIEEADQVTQEDFEEIDRRIRSIGVEPRIILSFNPTSAYSWLKSYFFDDCKIPSGNIVIIRTTYRDNKYIDPAYAETIERLKETNPSAYRVYGLGEWGIVEGVVFDKWDTQDRPERAKLTGYGLDFGYSSDPCALIAVYQLDNDVWLDERIYQTGLTNQDLGALMRAEGVKAGEEIIADSAEPKSIEELYRLGFNVHPCVKGADSVRNGINAMKALRLHVTPASVNVQREMSSYCWKQDKAGRWLPEPVDMFNHAIDAARYRITKASRIVRAPGYSARSLGL